MLDPWNLQSENKDSEGSMCVFVGGNGRSKIIPFPLAVAEIHGIEVPVEDGKKQNPLGH